MSQMNDSSSTIDREDEDTLDLVIAAHTENGPPYSDIPLPPSDGCTMFGHAPWYANLVKNGPFMHPSLASSSQCRDEYTMASTEGSSAGKHELEMFSWSQLLHSTVTPVVNADDDADSRDGEDNQQHNHGDDDGDGFAGNVEVHADYGTQTDRHGGPRDTSSHQVSSDAESDSDDSASTATSEDNESSSSQGSDDDESSSESSEDEPLIDIVRRQDSPVPPRRPHLHTRPGKASGSTAPSTRCHCSIHNGGTARFEQDYPVRRTNRKSLSGENLLIREQAKPSWRCQWRHCPTGHRPSGDPGCKKLSVHIRRLCYATCDAGQKRVVCGWGDCREEHNVGEMRRHVLQHLGYLRWLCQYCEKEWARIDMKNRHFDTCPGLATRRAGGQVIDPVAIPLYDDSSNNENTVAHADAEEDRPALARPARETSKSSAVPQRRAGAGGNAAGTRRRRTGGSDDEGDDEGDAEWRPVKRRRT